MLRVLSAATLWTLGLAYDNGMARLPPMGWNSWCTGGSGGEPSVCNLLGKDPCSEEQVKEIADAMVDQGLRELGYNYVALDDCWADKSRDGDGKLQPEAKKFPSGMKALADYVHDRGLLFGLYTCVGTKTCKGDRPGSFGHYETDAQTLADWGVDMVKMDHCGFPSNHTDQELYGQMSKALNATGRPMTFSLCSWGEANVWEWGADVSQMFRIQSDHLPLWSFPGDQGDQAGYGQGTREIIEWMADLQPSKWTKRHGWLDPDFLMTLYEPTMGYIKSRTEFSFWSIWSSPLLIDTDLRNLSKDKLEIIANPEVLAVNQDELVTAGDRVKGDERSGQVWVRDLSNGDKAVLLYHPAGELAVGSQTVSVDWSEIGWSSDDIVSVRDLWARKELGRFSGSFEAKLAARDVQFLRVSRSSVFV